MASKVTIVHRRETFRASQIMQKRSHDNPKIHFLLNSEVTEVHDIEQNLVTGVTVKNTVSGVSEFFPTDGLFIAIGHTPNTAIFNGMLALDEGGYITTTPGRPLTNIAGVFAAGDVQDTLYKQAITAAGTGCQAAMEAERFLEEHG